VPWLLVLHGYWGATCRALRRLPAAATSAAIAASLHRCHISASITTGPALTLCQGAKNA
jgi:hypothetical protein